MLKIFLKNVEMLNDLNGIELEFPQRTAQRNGQFDGVAISNLSERQSAILTLLIKETRCVGCVYGVYTVCIGCV